MGSRDGRRNASTEPAGAIATAEELGGEDAPTDVDLEDAISAAASSGSEESDYEDAHVPNKAADSDFSGTGHNAATEKKFTLRPWLA